MSAILKEAALDFRPMRESDLPDVMEIERSCYQHPWSATIFSDCIHAGYSCWVCGRGAIIEGYGVVSVAAGESHLLNLCVRGTSRRQGVGRKLLRHLISIARKRNAEVVFLEVRPSNSTARQLYASEGFNELGSRRNYYPRGSGREDALILGRAL
jgi:[ribosomal protein S18]-alanine N-acetyltransferase